MKKNLFKIFLVSCILTVSLAYVTAQLDIVGISSDDEVINLGSVVIQNGGGSGSNVTSVTSASSGLSSSPTTGDVVLTLALDFSSMPIGYTQDWFNLSNIPTGMFVMNGTTLDRTTYSGCYSYLGLQFGNTSASNFKLPDLRGRGVLYSNETGALSLVGSTGGQTNTTDLLTHNHNIMYGATTAREGTGAFFGYVSSIGSGANNANTDNSGTTTSVSVLDPYIILGGKIIRC